MLIVMRVLAREESRRTRSKLLTMKRKLIRKMTVVTWTTLALSGVLSIWFMRWYQVLGQLPSQDAELKRIEGLSNPLDWKASALSLTMSRHEFAHYVSIGLAVVVTLLSLVLISNAINLIWLRRLAKSNGEGQPA